MPEPNNINYKVEGETLIILKKVDVEERFTKDEILDTIVRLEEALAKMNLWLSKFN